MIPIKTKSQQRLFFIFALLGGLRNYPVDRRQVRSHVFDTSRRTAAEELSLLTGCQNLQEGYLQTPEASNDVGEELPAAGGHKYASEPKSEDDFVEDLCHVP
jgi:hypothetical protein